MFWSQTLYSIDEETLRRNVRQFQSTGWRVIRYGRYRYWDGFERSTVEMWKDPALYRET